MGSPQILIEGALIRNQWWQRTALRMMNAVWTLFGDYSVTCGVGSWPGVLSRERALWEVGAICKGVAGINLGKDPKA